LKSNCQRVILSFNVGTHRSTQFVHKYRYTEETNVWK